MELLFLFYFSEEKKTEKRTILKGVRSNRRFEMLMNLRRINQ